MEIFLLILIVCIPILLVRWIFRINYICGYLKKIHDQLEEVLANRNGPSDKKNGSFKVKCRFCGRAIEVPKEYVGNDVRCPFCKKLFAAQVSP